MDSIVLGQIFSCFFMTGLIWLVQLVHYPAFIFVDSTRFKDFHEFHSRRITWIVLPLMSAELLSAAALAWLRPGAFWWSNFASVVVLWIFTGLVSVPIHNKLAQQSDAKVFKSLVVSNWPRTFLWSARSVALLIYFC